jgi:hypothetical protein
MSFKINDFITHFSEEKEFAKTDKFEVRISIPPGLFSGGVSRIVDSYFLDTQFLTLSCEAAEFPGMDVTPIEFRHYGFIQRIPHHLNFPPVNLTFYATGNMKEKKFFDYWVNSMIPLQTGLIYYQDEKQYTSKVDIYQYDSASTVVYAISLQDAFPISVGNLSLNWGEDNAHRFQVTFAYKRWISYDENGSAITTAPSESIEPPSTTPGQFNIPNPYTNQNNVDNSGINPPVAPAVSLPSNEDIAASVESNLPAIPQTIG